MSLGTSALPQFYIAVGCNDAKLVTLLELLSAALVSSGSSDQAGPRLAICCGSRDSLDEVVHALLQTALCSQVLALHSDLTEGERELLLRQLSAGKASVSESGAGASPSGPQGGVDGLQMPGSVAGGWTALVTTDASLKALPKELLPVGSMFLLVNFDLPSNKEVLQRRVASVFGSGKERRQGVRCHGPRSVVVTMTSADEVPAFRSYERMFAAGTVREVPVHPQDMFA